MEQTPEQAKRRLELLDCWHQKRGTYPEWMTSDERKTLTSPNNLVRVVNWSNLKELCEKAHLDEVKLIAAYTEAVETGDVLFVEYEEAGDAQTS